MVDKSNHMNPEEKPDEVSLKTTLYFHSPSELQPQESCQESDGNLVTTCFSNILEKYSKLRKHYR